MTLKLRIFFSFLLIFSLQNIFALEITEKEIEGYIRGEYNRTFNYYGDISVIGSVALDNLIKFRGGVALGKAEGMTDIAAFTGVGYSPFLKVPLSFSLYYIYNGIPEFENNIHSILPFISYNAKWAGISVGVNFRFTSFFDEIAQFDSVLTLYVYVNLVVIETLQIGLSAGNFNDFHAKNISAYSLAVNSLIKLDERWTAVIDLELMQTGGGGLSSTLYGIAWRGGVKFSW
ncbi:MAG: hypothetical protein LBI28_07010 [Treponema sp.]|jgi:hypothetical protein|nr:hypothetical protein [Treponema sp.]